MAKKVDTVGQFAETVATRTIRSMFDDVQTRNTAQAICAHMQRNGLTAKDHDTEKSAAYAKSLRERCVEQVKQTLAAVPAKDREAMEVLIENSEAETTLEQLAIIRAKGTLKTWINYAWNLMRCDEDGVMPDGSQVNSGGRKVATRDGAPSHKAAPRQSAEKASAPKVQQVQLSVTREAAIEFMVTALGGDVEVVRYSIGYILDNPTFMREALINIVKARHTMTDGKSVKVA